MAIWKLEISSICFEHHKSLLGLFYVGGFTTQPQSHNRSWPDAAMPPRTPSLLVASSALARPARSGGSNIPKCLVEQCSANFSTTANREGLTKLRHRFIEWLNTKGKQYRSHRPGDTNYAGFGNTPFPLNPQFKSMEVLSDQARELIWKKIMRDGETIKAVSAELGVDIRRVAAVVRLKEVEKDWEAKVCRPPPTMLSPLT